MEIPPIGKDLLDRLRTADGTVVIDPPGEGPGYWAGGPSVVFHDGTYWLAYRLRRPVTEGRGYANVVARSADGVHFETVATVTSEQFSCASLERPAIVPLPGGGWRLYVSCSTLNSKHWWVEAIEADTVEALPDGRRTVVLPGDAATAWKDVVVSYTAESGWQMWACRHPLDGGDDEADRMSTWYAVSDDGLVWDFDAAPALTVDPRAVDPHAVASSNGQAGTAGGAWDQRGRRVGAVVPVDGVWFMLYDGRASAAENWEERTGVAIGATPDQFEPISAVEPIGGHLRPSTGLRYSSFLNDPAGGLRVYYETTRADGAHDLRTEYVPRP